MIKTHQERYLDTEPETVESFEAGKTKESINQYGKNMIKHIY